jgi:uncharacterized protein DUF4440
MAITIPRMLRRLPTLVLLLALVLPLAACWEEKQPAAWKTATGAEALEKLVWDEIKAKNWPEIEHHVGVNYRAVGPPGVFNREQLMEHLKQFEIDDYALGNVEVTPNGADMMVTYDFTGHGKVGGQPLPPVPLHMMTIWQQVKGGWIMVGHATVPPELPRP